ncbi:MAG: hypothetical protein OER04_18240 [Cyclobacteriaceae bacterium]|nr:hypothetical protein [Cyclobacteriaceae bacterium]
MHLSTTLTLLLVLCLSVRAQTTLSPEQWQQDLKFLQHTVHQDYPFLFKKTTAEDFDRQIDELHQAIPNLQDHQIRVGFAKVVSSFQYGHTSLWLGAKDHGFHQMPFNLYQFSDGIYVQGVHKKYPNALAAKVLKVEDKPVDEVLKAIRPVVPAENDQFFKAHGYGYLGSPEVLHAQGVTASLKTTVTLTLEKNGKTFDQIFEHMDLEENPLTYSMLLEKDPWIEARDTNETPLWLKHLDRVYYYEYLPQQKAVYVRHSRIRNEENESIEDFYGKVFEFIENNEVERLILDYRLNGGGNNYLNKPIITGILGCDKINQSGKLFVILGRRTYSACQNLVNEIDNYTQAIFVGEPTAENINFYGDNRKVELPHSKMVVRLSFAWWQDKPQWENAPWLAPDIAVDMSFTDYRTNHDPVLQAVWEYDPASPIHDPITYFTSLYDTGRQQEILPEAKKMVNDPRYRYYPFENQFNQIGYKLLGGQQFEPALFVFQLNAELFPESANVWDSLAEGLWKSGQIDKAKALYHKVIDMDPEGSLGQNAKEMLLQIKDSH